MTNKQEVIALIESRRESSTVDFKRDFYKKFKSSDFAKDIAAFANAAGGNKYLIFGIDDKSREVFGIMPGTFPSVDDLDAYLDHAIEPFVDIEAGIFEYRNHWVAYIKILDTNTNPPYVIKENCGQNGKIERGDIYIRKGTCNQKATRMDLDAMYMNNGECTVRIFEDTISIEPIHTEKGSIKESAYGHVSIEIYNSSPRPLLFSGGAINIFCEEISLSRSIASLLPNLHPQENPVEVLPKTKRIYTALFSFSSSDCVMLGFDKSGWLTRPTFVQAMLFDTDQNEYFSEKIPAMLLARGDILRKIQELAKPSLPKEGEIFKKNPFAKQK